MLKQVNELSDTILLGEDACKLSFEQIYRTMYNFSREKKSEKDVAQACKYLSDNFVNGRWKSLESWIMLQDCWLYAIRNHDVAKKTVCGIIFTIRCYPKLVDLICDKYLVVPDIRRLIASMVY